MLYEDYIELDLIKNPHETGSLLASINTVNEGNSEQLSMWAASFSRFSENAYSMSSSRVMKAELRKDAIII